MRFHVYFTVMRLLRRAESGESVRTLSAKDNGGIFFGRVGSAKELL